MPVTNWRETYISGKKFLEVDVAKFRISLDQDPLGSNFFIAVCAPDGGIGQFEALAQGDDGITPVLDTTVNRTNLTADDPTPDFASFTEIAPNVYRLNASWRQGQDGNDGTIVLDPTDYGTPVVGRMLVVTSDLSTFEYQAPKVGDRYYPVAVLSTPSGNTGFTVAQVGIPAQPWAYRPTPTGEIFVTGAASDVAVDFVARVNTTGGNIIARALGTPGSAPPSQTLKPWVPPTSPGDYDLIPANTAATILFRVERRTGSTATFTTDAVTTTAQVRVDPVP